MKYQNDEKKKEKMIGDIILYEKNDENIYTVMQRKKTLGIY